MSEFQQMLLQDKGDNEAESHHPQSGDTPGIHHPPSNLQQLVIAVLGRTNTAKELGKGIFFPF